MKVERDIPPLFRLRQGRHGPDTLEHRTTPFDASVDVTARFQQFNRWLAIYLNICSRENGLHQAAI